jgi:alkylation response protein AidB-like acyl-CoA dehydrogenase
MDFRLSKAQQRLQQKCRELAEGFLALSVAREWGGSGASFLDHTIAYEALGQGCPSTALAFNMHASVVMPLPQSTEISAEIKQRLRREGVDNFRSGGSHRGRARPSASQNPKDPKVP